MFDATSSATSKTEMSAARFHVPFAALLSAAQSAHSVTVNFFVLVAEPPEVVMVIVPVFGPAGTTSSVTLLIMIT
jgi:hypothetical protein